MPDPLEAQIDEILLQHKHDITTSYARGGLELDLQQADILAKTKLIDLMRQAALNRLLVEARKDEVKLAYHYPENDLVLLQKYLRDRLTQLNKETI